MEQVTADDDEHRQENEKRYSQGKPAATKNKSSFAFSESNGYDDEAIAAKYDPVFSLDDIQGISEFIKKV